MRQWNLADAKNRFSELVNLALSQGPQRIRRRNDEVIVMDAREYERLKGKRSKFKDYLTQGPSFDDLDLNRNPDMGRDISV